MAETTKGSEKYSFEYFEEHKRGCRVKRIQEKFETLWADAVANKRTAEAELIDRGFKHPDGKANFDKFFSSCDDFPLCCWPTELSELGSGVVLYFHFLVFLAMFLIVAFLVHIPALLYYMEEGQSIDAWNTDYRGFNAADRENCACIGQVDSRWLPIGMPPEYGSSCSAWDQSYCRDDSLYSYEDIGKWCCRKWCYAKKECENTNDAKHPSFANRDVSDAEDAIVRSYTACGKPDDDLPASCSNKIDKPFPQGFFKSNKQKLMSASFNFVVDYQGPGDLGPDEGSNRIVPLTYAALGVFLATSIVFMRQYQLFVDQQVNDKTTQPSDFAVMVHGLPRSATDEHLIADWFQANSIKGKDDTEIVKIVIGWDNEEYTGKINKMKALRKSRDALPPGHGQIPEINAKLMKIQNELKSCDPEIAARLPSSGTVVVVFRYQQDQRKCLERWRNPNKKLWYRDAGCCGGLCWGAPLPKFPHGEHLIHKISVHPAPNPIDINWEDFGVTTKERAKKFVKTNAAMGGVIFVTFLACVLVEYLQRATDIQYMRYIGIFVVFIGKFIVKKAANKFGIMEYFHTKTGQQASQALKLTVGLIVVQDLVFIPLNFNPKDWYIDGGLISLVKTLFIITEIGQPLVKLLAPERLIKYLITRCVVGIRLTDAKLNEWNEVVARFPHMDQDSPGLSNEDKQTIQRTKMEVARMEKVYEPAEIPLGKSYASAVRTFICCIIFAPLYPSICIWGAIGLTLQYWADKYMTLRKYRRPPEPLQGAQAVDSLVFIRYVGCLLIPITSYAFLTPSWRRDSHLLWWFLATFFPTLIYLLVPLQVWRKISCLALISHCAHKATKVTPTVGKENLEDYYHAQYLWHGKQMKYHKSQFMYARYLPEAKNPEFLEQADKEVGFSFKRSISEKRVPSTPDPEKILVAPAAGVVPSVALDIPVVEPVDGPSKGSHSDKGSGKGKAEAHDGSHGDKGSGKGKGSPRPSPSPSPQPSPRPEAKSGGGDVTWEFELHPGDWKRYGDDCHGFIENRYQKYKGGGAAWVTVKTRGKEVKVSFEKMTQKMLPDGDILNMRRLPES